MLSGASLCWIAAYAAFNFAVVAGDLRSRRVSNRLLVIAFAGQTAWLAARALGGIPASDVGAQGFGPAAGAFLLAMAVFFPLWKLRAMGAGDVKYFAVSGYLAGPFALVPILLAGTALAGLHAVAFVLASRYPLPVLRLHSGAWRRVPYAAYAACGALGWLAWQLAGRA